MYVALSLRSVEEKKREEECSVLFETIKSTRNLLDYSLDFINGRSQQAIVVHIDCRCIQVNVIDFFIPYKRIEKRMEDYFCCILEGTEFPSVQNLSLFIFTKENSLNKMK